MRRWLILSVFALFGVNSTGCLINVYSPDPQVRIRQLLVQSEDLRVIQEEWERIWFTDHPSHLTPFRVDGAVSP
jgi:hypothetical protein